MSTASFPRHARRASASPDLRSPAHASHLALVPASSIIEAEHPVRTPQDAFCARLKSARERRGISVKAVADSTKVAASLFEALERGDISRWPKGLYKRSFFRGYAAAVGLPVDSTAAEFLRLFPDEKPRPEAAPPPRVAPEGEETSPGLRLTLASDRPGVPLHHRVPKHAAADAMIVVVAIVVLVWWTQVDLQTGAAILALCGYPQAARMVRQHLAGQRARRAAVQPAEHRQAADEGAEGSRVTAAATP